MLKRLTHTTIMVRNQQEALQFYVEKLGFEKRMVAPLSEMGSGAHWVTIGVKGQPDMEIVLQDCDSQRERLIGKGPCLIFEVDDVWQTYQELRTKGIEFIGEPQSYPWGIETFLFDLDGNMHLISQPLVEPGT